MNESPRTIDSLVIADGATDSEVVTAGSYGGVRGFVFYVPSGVEGTVAIHVSPDGITFYPLYSNGLAVTLVEGGATPITFASWQAFKLVASTAQTGAVTIPVTVG